MKIEIQDKEFSKNYLESKLEEHKNNLDFSSTDIKYFVFNKTIFNQAYNQKQPIKILNKNGDLKDIAEASDQLNLQALRKPVIKYFLCYPKKMKLEHS